MEKNSVSKNNGHVKSNLNESRDVDLAYIDDLTGLYNRRYLNTILFKEILKAKDEDKKLTLFMMDCDNLKGINDNHGHSTGDRVLIDIAQILKREIGESGTVVRYAGDEFTVVLYGKELDESLKIADGILQLTSERKIEIKGGRKQVHYAISIGIAVYPYDADTAKGLIDRADQILYSAKRTGKSKISTTQDLIVEVQDRYMVTNALPCKKFIDRKKEGILFKKGCESVKGGAKKLVLIEGEQGVGKTRLILELFDSNKTDPSFFLICREENLTHQYGAISDAFNGFLESLEVGKVLAALNSLNDIHKFALVSRINKIKDLPIRYSNASTPSTAKLGDEDIFFAFINFIKELESKIIPISVDDILWIDKGSLRVIQHMLSESFTTCGTYVVGTIPEGALKAQTEQKTPFLEFLQDKRPKEMLEIISLEPLAEDVVSEMLKSIFSGFSLPGDAEKKIFQMSRGTPSNIEGIIKQLLTDKIIYPKKGKWNFDEKRLTKTLTIKEYQGPEHRGYMRLDIDCPVDYARLSDDLKPAYNAVEDSYSKNISASGISFIASEKIPVGSFLELRIKVPSTDKFIAAIGKVLRCEPEGKKFGVALVFIWISQKDKELIEEYVKSRKQEEPRPGRKK